MNRVGSCATQFECWQARFTGKLSVMVVALWLSAFSSAHAYYSMPKNLEDGWHGDVHIGALATFGPTDSSAITARSNFTYRSKHWEHELDAKWYRSASEALVSRRDVEGQVVRDANDKEIKDLVRSTTNNRRYLNGQSRWFFTSRHYVFAIADLDVNTPADLESSTRQISGLGYKLYRAKNDLISAEFGVGRKKRVEVSGDSEEGAIGYFGFRYKHKVSKKMGFSFDLNSDFGSENRYSEAELALKWKLRDPLSLSLKYEARLNDTDDDSSNSNDDELEAALSVSLSVEVF